MLQVNAVTALSGLKGKMVEHLIIGYYNYLFFVLLLLITVSIQKQVSIFGGSAWTLDPTRNKYYYHIYGPDQPDLNLRSDKVKRELKSVARFWLDQGVSGLRLLSVPYFYESANTTLDEKEIPGVTPNAYASLDHIYTKNLDETYNFIGEIRAVLQEYEDKDGDHR